MTARSSNETPAEIISEIDDQLAQIAAEVCKGFGTGNPRHARLRSDIQNAYLVALASPTFREAVRQSLRKAIDGT